MDKGKQQGSSPFSFTEDLFGPKNSSKSPTSSAGHFGSIFDPPNSALVKKDKNNVNGNTEPCYNSSIYYGGQEVYSPSTHTTVPRYVNSEHSGTEQLKKNSATVDRNENNSSSASRGIGGKGHSITKDLITSTVPPFRLTGAEQAKMILSVI